MCRTYSRNLFIEITLFKKPKFSIASIIIFITEALPPLIIGGNAPYQKHHICDEGKNEKDKEDRQQAITEHFAFGSSSPFEQRRQGGVQHSHLLRLAPLPYLPPAGHPPSGVIHLVRTQIFRLFRTPPSPFYAFHATYRYCRTQNRPFL